MTPAEKAVIDAAKRWADADTTIDSDRIEDAAEALQDAVATLHAQPAPTERPRPWSEIVTEDEIYSTKTGKWYRVLATIQLADGTVRAQLEGVPKPFTNPAKAKVLCRRGESGEAVDVFIDVFRSGPS